jgi:hypothetical protein
VVDAGVDLGDLGSGAAVELGRAAAVLGDGQELVDFGQGEAEALGGLDGSNESDRVLRVLALAGRAAGRGGEQARRS